MNVSKRLVLTAAFGSSEPYFLGLMGMSAPSLHRVYRLSDVQAKSNENVQETMTSRK